MSSNYNFDNTPAEVGDIVIFPLAENTPDVKLGEPVFNDDDKPSMDMFLIAPDGAKIKDRFFPVDEDWIRNRHKEKSDNGIKEEINRAYNGRNGIMTRMQQYVIAGGTTREKMMQYFSQNVKGEGFKPLCLAFINLINALNAKNSPKLYVKTVLSNTGYVSVPRYANFLRNMATEEADMKWSDNERTNNIAYAKVRTGTQEATNAEAVIDLGGSSSSTSSTQAELNFNDVPNQQEVAADSVAADEEDFDL